MKKRSTPLPAVEPVDCLATIFSTRRDLLEPLKRAVLRELPLTLDEGDTLTMLYGLLKLGWPDAQVDSEGFVKVADLRLALVHDPGKLSRRIEDFRERGLIKVRMSTKRRTYADAVRITDAGGELAKRVWERYRKLAEHLLAGVSRADMETHCRVNNAISEAVQKLNQPVLLTLLD
jgi:DNA-binding MarR family transcriptional regulator